jgi:cellobiose phosphorylase
MIWSVRFHHEESFGTHYVPANLQRVAPVARPARYKSHVVHAPANRIALSRTRYAPAVFALHHGPDDAAASQIVELMQGADRSEAQDGLFAAEWASRSPDMSRERNPVLRTEMPWHAYVLDAMATYSAYFGETFVPQGAIYAYEDGENISNRDKLPALLPLCHSNPLLWRWRGWRFLVRDRGADGRRRHQLRQGRSRTPAGDAQLTQFRASVSRLRARPLDP